MDATARTVLHFAPHPDDEVLGAPATLMALRDAGHRIVNVACTLGSSRYDALRRRGELEEACRRTRFELAIAERGEPLEALVARLVAAHPDALVVAPTPYDRHPRHEAVAAAVRAALERRRSSTRVFAWSLWGPLLDPTLATLFDEERLREIAYALEAHASQLARNRYERLLHGRAEAAAVLAAELLFGFGTPGVDAPYAELLSEHVLENGDWRLGRPRILDPSAPFG